MPEILKAISFRGRFFNAMEHGPYIQHMFWPSDPHGATTTAPGSVDQVTSSRPLTQSQTLQRDRVMSRSMGIQPTQQPQGYKD